MRATLVTVGDPQRRTGGYRYHARLLALGVLTRQVVAGCRDAGSVDPDDADVVVVDALARIAVGPWVARWRAKVPVVVLVHELPSVADPGRADPADEEPLLSADLLVAVSDSVRDTLLVRGVPAERIRVVRPGYDRHCPDGHRPPRSGEVRVLCVAQWIRRKGITGLLRAWSARERPGARLILVGETTADPAYTAEVRALLTGSVEVLGAIDDTALAAQYAQADVFALPSTAERAAPLASAPRAHAAPSAARSLEQRRHIATQDGTPRAPARSGWSRCIAPGGGRRARTEQHRAQGI